MANLNSYPAGALDHQYEFFAGPDLHGYCLNSGRVTDFNQFDDAFLSIVEPQILKHHLKIKAIHRMGITDRAGVIGQYLICNYGGFDHQADMIDGQLQATEYWPCPKRGKCSFEGIVCDGLKTASGEYLSPREIQITRLIAEGCLDKDIAIKLNISLTTVATHTKNIRRKTLLYRKSDITRFAIKNQLS